MNKVTTATALVLSGLFAATSLGADGLKEKLKEKETKLDSEERVLHVPNSSFLEKALREKIKKSKQDKRKKVGPDELLLEEYYFEEGSRKMKAWLILKIAGDLNDREKEAFERAKERLKKGREIKERWDRFDERWDSRLGVLSPFFKKMENEIATPALSEQAA